MKYRGARRPTNGILRTKHEKSLYGTEPHFNTLLNDDCQLQINISI